MVSISRTGATEPSTWTMSSSSKQRTTWTMASTSRIWDRNLLPKPSPLYAPRTRPAISTNSMVVGVIFSGLYISANTSSRGSGLPVAISRTIRARSNHSQRASNASSSASAGSSPAPDDAIYCFRSAIAAKVYQFEAEAWKMSVTSLSTICGMSSPSTSVSRRVDS